LERSFLWNFMSILKGLYKFANTENQNFFNIEDDRTFDMGMFIQNPNSRTCREKNWIFVIFHYSLEFISLLFDDLIRKGFLAFSLHSFFEMFPYFSIWNIVYRGAELWFHEIIDPKLYKILKFSRTIRKSLEFFILRWCYELWMKRENLRLFEFLMIFIYFSCVSGILWTSRIWLFMENGAQKRKTKLIKIAGRIVLKV